MTDQLAAALTAADLKIIKYAPGKQRPVSTNDGTLSLEKFIELFKKKLGKKATKFVDVFEALHDIEATEEMVYAYADKKKILRQDGKAEIDIPPDMVGLTLNLNLSARGREDRFFLTDERETVSRVSGEAFLLIHQMDPLSAAAQARKVIPDYMPRGSSGVTEIENDGGRKETIFNVYTPPEWTRYQKWNKLQDKLPVEFDKLVKHLFPIPIEREFFFSWLHDSLFKRSYTFLILCGAPGTGKNRLKLVMRALHGHVNSVDGKKSTLVERFNSQLSESTLAWFDELRYDVEMENTMKELQNDSISIERKGVDATRATKVHASIVISNNKERDNYIAFDARKFAPLVVRPERLEKGMTSDEIDALTQKVEDPKSDTYDITWIAQIAKWIQKHGASKKWPHQEYRGPMFWALAHTSMTRWQKKAVMMILEPERGQNSGFDEKKGAFLWSTIQGKAQRKNGDRSLQFPDFTSVRAFFEVFRDGKGQKAFSTEQVTGNNILGDFWVKPLFKHMEIITDAVSVIEQRGKANAKAKKTNYDL